MYSTVQYFYFVKTYKFNFHVDMGWTLSTKASQHVQYGRVGSVLHYKLAWNVDILNQHAQLLILISTVLVCTVM